jgi:hypothetical protein
MAIKTFTTGEVLTASDTNTYLANAGLVYVTSATVPTGVTSVTVSNCFSSTYDNYRIVMSNVVCSGTDNNITLTFSGSTGNTYAYFSRYDQYFAGTSGVNNGFNVASIIIAYTDANVIGFAFDVFNPNLAKYTYANSSSQTRNYSMNQGGVDATTNAHTGFTVTAAVGTFTGGTITVYGYRKA